jgi:hypothetical protein
LCINPTENVLAKQKVAARRQEIHFLRYKDWMLVGSASTYKVLASLGVPVMALHASAYEILLPVFRKAKVKVTFGQWIDTWAKLLAKLAERFQPDEFKVEGNKLLLRFNSVEEQKEVCDKLQQALNRYSFRAVLSPKSIGDYIWIKCEVKFDRELAHRGSAMPENQAPSYEAQVQFGNEYEMLIGYSEKATPQHVNNVHVRINALAGNTDAPVFVRDLVVDSNSEEQRKKLRELATVLLRASL